MPLAPDGCDGRASSRDRSYAQSRKRQDVYFALSTLTPALAFDVRGSTSQYPETAARLVRADGVVSRGSREALRGAGREGHRSAVRQRRPGGCRRCPRHSLAAAEAVARGSPSSARQPARSRSGRTRRRCGRDAGGAWRIQALKQALARVLDDSCYRARLAEGARLARERLPTSGGRPTRWLKC